MKTTSATFDVWDVLLKRHCRPEVVKLFSCWALGLLHAGKIRQEWRDAHQLLGARQAIELELSEQSLREGRGGYRLDDVIERLMQRCGITSHLRQDEIRPFIEELVQIELEQERFVSYPSPDALALLREHTDQRLAFVADYHLGSRDVASLLYFHGLHRCSGLGLTTADLDVAAEAGSLFDVAQLRFGFDPGGWEHFGNPITAQRLGAARLGIRTAPLPLATSAAHPSAGEREWEPLTYTPEARGTAGAEIEGLDDDDQADALEMMQIGMEAAPLFAGFALWILEQAIRNESERIYFFTREGQFFSKVYEAVAGVYDSGIQSPPFSVVSVSRLSTFAPSLDEIHPKSFSDVWALYKPQSVAGFFATLGIETLCDVDELKQFGLSLNERIVSPATDPRFIGLLAHPPFRARIMSSINDARKRLLDYLSSEGLDGSMRRVSTVDVGWRGSIQSNIASLFPATSFQGLYLGLDKSKLPLGKNSTKSAYVVDLRRSMRNSNLLTYVAPMEFLCSAPFGSTVGYSLGANSEPIRMSVDKETQAAFDKVVAPFQAGVLAGALDWAREMRTHALTSSDLLPDALASWQRLVQRPNEQMALGFADTTVDETFGFGRTFRLPRHIAMSHDARGFSEAPPATTIVQDTVTIVQDAVRNIPWPQAFAHYARSNALIKFIVPAAVRAARRGHRLQQQVREILSRKGGQRPS